MRNKETRFVDFVITESNLLLPQSHGGKLTLEQRQFVIDELRRMAEIYPGYNAAVIRALAGELKEVK